MKIIIIIALGIAAFIGVLWLLCVLAILAYQGITYVWNGVLDFGYYMFKTMASDIRQFLLDLKKRKNQNPWIIMMNPAYRMFKWIKSLSIFVGKISLMFEIDKYKKSL